MTRMNRNTVRATLASTALLLPFVAGCKDAVGPAVQFTCVNGSVVVDGREVPAAPNGYAVAGNRIVEVADCEPHRFVGVSRPSLAYAPNDERLAGPSAAADFALIRGWGANTVRIEVSQNFWVPTARWYDPEYPGRVDRAVKAARAAGLDVILALQTSDRGDPAYPGDIFGSNPQQEMADANHSVPFWRDLANRYKGDGRILFELFSEPFYAFHGGRKSDWELWLNGGTVPAGRIYDEDRRSFRAVGMQQLYDVVRATGANNIVIVGGTHWAYYLDQVPNHRVRGYNIAYAAHPWDHPDKQPATWDRDWAFLAETDPVMLTETGSYTCTSDYLKQVLDKADQLQLSWIAWAWTVPTAEDIRKNTGDPDCNSLHLLKDWSGTPSWTGSIVKQRLGSY